MNPYTEWPEGLKSWKKFSDSILADVSDRKLLNLVMIRASQINRCAFCIDMHTEDALAAGEDQRRLHLVETWSDLGWFDERETAALAFTEAVTRLDDGHGIPGAVIDDAAEKLGPEMATKLLLALVVINGWNRINVTARLEPRR